MPASTLLPTDIQARYEIFDWRHASAILATEFAQELDEICKALRSFQLLPSYITASGGNESEIPKAFNRILRPDGWLEGRMTAQYFIDGKSVSSDTHKVDYLKNRIAFDLEWNSKDQTFDRDLLAFRTFFDLNKISVGVIVTRSRSNCHA